MYKENRSATFIGISPTYKHVTLPRKKKRKRKEEQETSVIFGYDSFSFHVHDVDSWTHHDEPKRCMEKWNTIEKKNTAPGFWIFSIGVFAKKVNFYDNSFSA